jgi:Cu/Ag efflux protein CusF
MLRRLSLLALVTGLPLAAKIYAVDGIVIAVDPAARTMLVSHRAIARYMPAMLMPFHAESEAELGAIHPGARILFDLSVTKAQAMARHIRLSGAPDGALPAPKEKLAIGAELPDFELTDQNGRGVRTADLHVFRFG